MKAMGSSWTTIAALKSYIDAVRRLKPSATDFKSLILELDDVIKSTEPRLIPLLHLVEEFEADMQPHFQKPLDEAKALAVDILTKKLQRFESETGKLTDQCVNHIQDGDFIITHSPTGGIRDAFIRAHTQVKRKFKLLILKQDLYRTKNLIRALNETDVEYILIPEYNLSHFLAAVNKLFIGAVSVTPDNKVVTGVGTANIVTLCHSYKIPVYLFIETLKFAHRPLQEQHIHKKETDEIEADVAFHMTTFSHDIVDLFMVNHVITEHGEKKVIP